MIEKGDDVRVAGVSVGEVKKVEHYERNNALVTFRVKSDVPLTTSSRAEVRFLNLVGDRYLALEAGADADAEAPGGRRRHPDRPDQPGPRPDHALQRVQAALPGADARPGQRAEHEPGPGPPGRGRHRPGPAPEDGVAHHDAGRPRPAHRRGHQQPQHHAGDRQLAVRAGHPARHRAEGLDDRPGRRPQGHRIVAGQHLRPHRRGGGPAPGRPTGPQVRRRPAAQAGDAAEQEEEPRRHQGAGRPAARVDDRPDPDRHLRLLVQLLRLRLLRRDQAARRAR